MIVWDKKRRNLSQADCEIAWTSLKGQSRIFEWRWNGMLQQDMKHKEKRIHPTQKPVALYEWLLNKFAEQETTILDTHVGSGSSLIACERTGHKYVGFEINKVFYDTAVKRIEEEREKQEVWKGEQEKSELLVSEGQESCKELRSSISGMGGRSKT